MQTQGLPDGFGVGEWRVHPSQCRLTREDRTVQVRPKVMDLLVALAKRPGVVVSKDALLEEVWGTEAVSESALTRTVTELVDRHERRPVSGTDDAGRMAELLTLIPPRPRDFDLFNQHLMVLVWSGRFSDAEWVFSERHRRGVQGPWLAIADRQGQLRVRQGRYAEGLAMLQRLKPDPMGPRYFVQEHVALAYRGLGNSAAAIVELERVGEKRAEAVTAEGWQVYSWLRCRVLLAELYREAGRQADAERIAREVRGLLSSGEPDHPLLQRLRPEALTSSNASPSTALNRLP